MNRYTLSAILIIIPLSPGLSLATARGLQGADCKFDTVDCSAYETGYEWADLNNIESVGDCLGNSDSFIEGCHAYVEEDQSDQNETSAPVSNETKNEEKGGTVQESPAKDATDQPD